MPSRAKTDVPSNSIAILPPRKKNFAPPIHDTTYRLNFQKSRGSVVGMMVESAQQMERASMECGPWHSFCE